MHIKNAMCHYEYPITGGNVEKSKFTSTQNPPVCLVWDPSRGCACPKSRGRNFYKSDALIPESFLNP